MIIVVVHSGLLLRCTCTEGDGPESYGRAGEWDARSKE